MADCGDQGGWAPKEQKQHQKPPRKVAAGQAARTMRSGQIHKVELSMIFQTSLGYIIPSQYRLQHGTLSQWEKQKGRLQFKFTMKANTRAKNSIWGFREEERKKP